MKKKRFLRLIARFATPGLMLLLASCAKADSVANYEAPDTANLVPMDAWGTSGKLMFRVMKVEELKAVMREGADKAEEKAPGGMRFVVVTIDAMPYDQGKGLIDYPARVSLVDRAGLAYKPNAERFTRLNSLPPQTGIDAGQFVERRVAFLVPKEFKPAALRCTGADDAKLCWLALKVKD